jgi:flagella basal body P-ring formation protein FlgA
MRAALPLLLGLFFAPPALGQWPAGGQSPVPRAQALVEGAQVTLGDIFEHAGPRADATLGPAPAPGRRFVLESAQLGMIARDYGLAWRPLGGEERVVVERPGRAMRREEVLDPLKAELVALGADPALDLDMPGFQLPILPASAPEARVAVDGAGWDNATRRFSATLVIVADGMPTLTQRVSGRAVAMRDVVVATRALRSGDVLSDADVDVVRMPVERVPGRSADDAEPLLGQRLRRAVAAGAPLAAADVVATPMIMRDAPVTLLVETPGMTLTAQARALEDGYRGRAFVVLNLASGALVQAEALDRGSARAIGPAPPGSLPASVMQRATRRDMPR